MVSPSSAGTKRDKSAFCRNSGATKIDTTPTPRGTPRCSGRNQHCGFNGGSDMKGLPEKRHASPCAASTVPSAPCIWAGTVPAAAAGRAIRAAPSPSAPWPTVGYCFAGSVRSTPAPSMTASTTATPLSPTGTGSRISPGPRNWGWMPASRS